jgi:hypothetical protein
MRRRLGKISAIAVTMIVCLLVVSPVSPAGAASEAPPGAPTELRIERDAQGFIQFFRWDRPVGVDGPLSYFLWMESDPQFFGPGAVENTSQLLVSAYETPVCDGCQYAPEQTIFVWVVAYNRHGYSPPSNRLTLRCCPF